jgi:hypothetical protein
LLPAPGSRKPSQGVQRTIVWCGRGRVPWEVPVPRAPSIYLPAARPDSLEARRAMPRPAPSGTPVGWLSIVSVR